MTTLDDPAVSKLLTDRNHAVVSTLDGEGGIHSTVVWVDVLDGKVAVNSAVGRKWPTNLAGNPTINVLVYDESNPYEYVEVRGTAQARLEGADAHIDALAKKYLDADSYPFRQDGEQRISYLVDATSVRHQKQ
ncbi:MAG: class F420-dependent oxidoreductase [Frankiales bacterium]|nr:class F420-dependent oxidoreductase [Frankiales bacterium]